MKKLVLTMVAAAALAACGGADEGADEGAVALDTMAAESAAAGGGAVTDPQIADIVVAANEVDIAAGELARTKATDAQVKQFAERMVSDHTGVNQQAGQLAQRLGVTPEPNPTSQQLREGGEATRARLEGLSGAEFDRAYIDHEVAYHQQVLDAIDQTLIPNAQNAELKTLIEQVRPAIDGHLQFAKQIQSSLAGS